jgi:integrase
MTVSPVPDAAGRQRSPATLPGYHAGRPPRNKGRRYPADPPTVEEIIAVMRQTGHDRHGSRLRALVIVLWRGGLRIQEALALGERDLDPRRGSLLLRSGKGGRRHEIGMDAWGWEQLRRGWMPASSCRSGRCSALSTARPAGGRGRAPTRASSSAARRPRGHPATLRAAPATPRPRRRARPRGRPAQRDPAPTRPRQPRHHLDLPAGHRHRRDHRHRPRPARANDVRHRRSAALSNPKPRQREFATSRCSAVVTTAW